jgi:hypothetical protein
MLKERMFFIAVAIALLVMAVLVINQTAATAKVATEVMGQSETAACPFSAEERASMRGEYDAEIGIWLPRTDRGFTGVDGGVLGLLNCR